MTEPWKKYAGGTAPIYNPKPADPYKENAEIRANEVMDMRRDDQRMQREKFEFDKQQSLLKANKEKEDAPYSQSALDAFDRAISSAERLRDHVGMGAAVGSGFDPQAIGSYNPISGKVFGGTNAAAFEGELEAMKAQVFLPMVQSMKGLGALSNAEGDKLTAAIGATNTNMPEEAFQASLDRIMQDLKYYRDRSASGKAGEGDATAPEHQDGDQPIIVDPDLAGPNGTIDAPAPNTPIQPYNPLEGTGSNASNTGIVTGPVDRFVTDVDKANASELNDAFRDGASAKELIGIYAKHARNAGAPTSAQQIKKIQAAVAYRKANGVYNAFAPGESGERSATENIVSALADSPVGAFGAGSINALTLGGADELASMIGGEAAGERMQFAKDYHRENSPVTSMAGEAAGLALAALAAPASAAALTTVRGGAATGGVYGALDQNDNRIGGVIGGALAGGVINKYAPGVASKVGELLSPVAAKVSNILPGSATRALAKKEVAENADVVRAAQSEGLTLRQPDVRPSLRDSYGGAEASAVGGPKIQDAAKADQDQIANRLTELGGSGTPRERYNFGKSTQDAVKAEKKAMADDAGKMYRRVEAQAPGFKASAKEVGKAIDERVKAVKAVSPTGNEKHIKVMTDMKRRLEKTGVSLETIQANRDIVKRHIGENNLQFDKQEVELLDVLRVAGQELERSLAQSGNAAALASLKQANAKWTEYSDFKKLVYKELVGKGRDEVAPEKAAARLLSMMSGNSDTAVKVYKTLPKADKDDFKALLAENLGSNRGGDFSMAYLANNLSDKKVSYRALREVFGDDGFQSLMNLRAVAKAKVDAQKGKNFSNTSRAANNSPEGFGSFVRGALGFSVGDVIGATAAVAGPKIADKLSTNRVVRLMLDPNVSKWIKNIPNTKDPKAVNAYIKRLDLIKAPLISADIIIMKDFLQKAAGASPGRLAASENESD